MTSRWYLVGKRFGRDPSPIIWQFGFFPIYCKGRIERCEINQTCEDVWEFLALKICGAKIAFSTTFDVIQPGFWDRVRYLMDFFMV